MKPTKAFLKKVEKIQQAVDACISDKWCDPNGKVPQFKTAGTLQGIKKEVRAILQFLESYR